MTKSVVASAMISWVVVTNQPILAVDLRIMLKNCQTAVRLKIWKTKQRKPGAGA